MATDHTVFIGKKELMDYVMAVMTHFNAGAQEVIVKARGKNISKAVDVAEVLRNRFYPEAKVNSVQIGTEKIQNEDGRTANVSSIEIFLGK